MFVVRTMLAELSVCAERTEARGGVGVLSNAASSVLTLYRATHVSAAVRCTDITQATTGNAAFTHPVSAPAVVQDTTQPIRRYSGVSLRTTTQ